MSILLIVAIAAALRRWPGLSWFAACLVGVNVTTLTIYCYDKFASIHDFRRVPERLLHILAVMGGSPAALIAQSAFRHKTIKRSFRLAFWAILTLQLLLLASYIWYAKPWKV